METPSLKLQKNNKVRTVYNEFLDKYSGDIPIDDHGKLLGRFLQKYPIGSSIIMSYNYWVSYHIKKQVENILRFETPNKKKSFVVSVEKIKKEPSHTRPKDAKDQKETYYIDIIGRINMFEKRSDKIHETSGSDFVVVRIPLMVGSEIDTNIYNKTEKEIIEMGECPNDCYGYFIHKGNELVFNNRILLRENIPIITKRKSRTNKSLVKTVCQFTSPSVNGLTSYLILMIGKWKSLNKGKATKIPKKSQEIRQKSIEVIISGLSDMKEHHSIPLYLIFYFLGLTPKKAEKKILSFVSNPEWISRIKTKLSMTKARFLLLYSKYKNSSKEKNLNFFNYLENYVIKRRIYSDDDEHTNILTRVFNNLYSNITSKNADIKSTPNEKIKKLLDKKINLLASHTARLLEWMIGERDYDDIDSMSKKRIQPPSDLMKMLLTKCLLDHKANINKILSDNTDIATIGRIINKMGSSIFSEFENNLQPGNWKLGTKNTYHENVTEYVNNRESILTMNTDILKTRKTTSKHSQDIKLRSSHGSEWGFLCIVHTPDDERCGIVQYLSLPTQLTFDEDDILVMRCLKGKNLLIKDYKKLKIVKNKEYSDYSGLDEEELLPININGIIKGLVYPKNTYKTLKDAKKNGEISKTTGIILEKEALYITTYGSRPIRPLLIIENDELLIDKYNGWNLSIDELFTLGYMEFLDPWEQESENVLIATSKYDFREKLNQREIKINELNLLLQKLIENKDADIKNLVEIDEINRIRKKFDYRIKLINNQISSLKKYSYSHCEIDPNSVFGVAASTIPRLNDNPAPRNFFQCRMVVQAIGTCPTTNYDEAMRDTKILVSGNKPIFQTQLEKEFGLDKFPIGNNIILAIMAYGDNQEDAIIMNRSSIDLGLFRTMTYVVIREYLKKDSPNDYFGMPDINDREKDLYRHLDSRGLPIVGSYITEKDAIIGKIRKRSSLSDKGRDVNISYFANFMETGIVDRVDVVYDNNIIKRVFVRIKNYRSPSIGDKFAARCSQKGTLGRILNKEDMPFTQDGLIPDIIINSHSFPSRMTMGMIIEMLVSKVGALTGERYNASPFKPFNIKDFMRVLKEYGFSSSGKEYMTDGKTGDNYLSDIYIAPCYYLALKHMSSGKIQSRGFGSIDIGTNQPVKGKQIGGGLRFGEMEATSIVSYGASNLLQSITSYSSDQWEGTICNKCGRFVVSNVLLGKIICPIHDYLEKSECSVVKVPYSFKSLIYYINAMGIDIRMYGKPKENLEIIEN